MNNRDMNDWIKIQGHSKLDPSAIFDGVEMTAGQKFEKGRCSGMAGFSVGVAKWEIIGFAEPIVWMALCDDPNPDNWSEKVRNAPSVIVKDAWGYDIYSADNIVSYLKGDQK